MNENQMRTAWNWTSKRVEEMEEKTCNLNGWNAPESTRNVFFDYDDAYIHSLSNRLKSFSNKLEELWYS